MKHLHLSQRQDTIMQNTQSRLHISTHNKVPAVTLVFWVIKLLTTTVGETAADYLAVDVGLGQGLTRLIMFSLLAVALVIQMRSSRFHPGRYWLTVLLISIVGTQVTDALTDGLAVSLYLSTPIFAVLLAATFGVWYRCEKTLSIQAIDTPRREAFYWLAVLCTFALGTAAGDLATEALGLGFKWGAVVFGGLIGLAALGYRAGTPFVPTFWVAYILTRPLGAAMGDWLSQAHEYGGLGWGAAWTSVAFLSAMAALIGWSVMRLDAHQSATTQA